MYDPFPAISVTEARDVAEVVNVVDGVSTPTRGVGDAGPKNDPFGLRPPPCRAPPLPTLLLLPLDTNKLRCGLAGECDARLDRLEVEGPVVGLTRAVIAIDPRRRRDLRPCCQDLYAASRRG